MRNAERFVKTFVCWNSLWILLFMCGMGVFLVGMPKYSDDWWFMSSLGDWLHHHGCDWLTDGVNVFSTGLPMEEVKSLWKFHYCYDNARIGNVIVMFFLFLPKWIGSGLSLLCLIYAVMSSFRLLGIDWRRSALIPLSLALWYIIMPWQNHMGSLVYQFNYVLPSALSLWVLNMKYARGKSQRPAWLLFAGGVLLGAWNEAFSLPLLCGVAGSMLFDREERSRRNILLLLALCVGLAWLFAAPGFSVRSGRLDHSWVSDFGALLKRFAKILVTLHPGVVLFTLLELVGLYRCGPKKCLSDGMSVLINVSIWASVILALFSTASPRSGWWADMMSVVGIVHCLKENFGSMTKRAAFAGVAYAVMSLSMFSLILTDIFVIRTARECRRTVADFLADPFDNIYSSWLGEMDKPIFLLTKFDSYSISYTIMVPSFMLPDGSRTPDKSSIVHPDLRNYTPEDGELLPGDGNVRKVGNFYVLEMDSVRQPYGTVYADIDCMGNRRRDVRAFVVPFISEADGKRYYYLRLTDRNIERYLGRVVSIDRFIEDEYN